MKEKNHSFDEEVMVDAEDILSESTEHDIDAEDATYKDKIKVLREKLATCEEEKKKNLDDLHRTRADFLNSKRRLEEQFVRDRERATDKLLTELITLVDSFDMAMADTELWQSVDMRWRSGVEAIHTKLLATLREQGMIRLEPLGESFDPQEHEAVSSSVVSDAAKVDTVVAVLQKGFKRNNTIIRPAKVVVGTL
jgi:molecular chaperone GrpE